MRTGACAGARQVGNELSGIVHAMVQGRHRGREFVAFVHVLGAAHPENTKLRVVLDDHSAHRPIAAFVSSLRTRD